MVTITYNNGIIRREIHGWLKQLKREIKDQRIWLAVLQWFMYSNHEQQLKYMSEETRKELDKLGVI